MYSREQIQDVAEEILKNYQGKSKEEILVEGFFNISKVLEDDAEFYRSFGPFWWMIKKLFPEYLEDNQQWYCSGKYDDSAVKRFGYEDDFLNYAVSIYYSNQNNYDNPTKHFLAVNGDDYEEYIIFDEDAPMT